jgi:hypothetical protein
MVMLFTGRTKGKNKLLIAALLDVVGFVMFLLTLKIHIQFFVDVT